MKALFTLLIFGAVFSVKAQPVFSSACTPVTGDVYQLISYDTTGVVQGPAGANQTWTFTLVNPVASSLSYSDTNGVANLSLFPSANAVVNDGNGTITYFELLVGYGSNYGYINGTTQLVFSDPATVFYAPVNFGQVIGDICSGTVTGTVNSTVTGTVDHFYDGYGTLIINGTTIQNAIRIFVEENYDYNTGGNIVSNHIENFNWYNSQTNEPVLTIRTVYLGFSGTVVLSKQIITYGSPTGLTELKPDVTGLYPNPSENEITVNGALSGDDFQIFSSDGRQILSGMFKDNLTVITTSLHPGMYLLRINNKNGSPFSTLRFVKK